MRSPESELKALRDQDLYRELHITDARSGLEVTSCGDRLVNFSSNDYLGLSGHPDLAEAATAAAVRWGSGASASRLIYGGSSPHREFERAAASYFGKEAALSFANGYCAALGVLGAVLRKGDTVILDKRCHACLIDGARLSGATLRVFPHNNLAKLERLLQGCCQPQSDGHRVLVVTESVFSMDGDLSPLAEIVRLTGEYGALLLLDEAHAFGLLGTGGRGLADSLAAVDQVDFLMATFGKAAGAAGGLVACSAEWAALIANQARSFIYSTAPPPAQAAAALAGLKLVASNEGDARRLKLRKRIECLANLCERPAPPAAILPIVLGPEGDALQAAAELRVSGFLVPAIRYPTVARGSARLRVTVSSAHRAEDIARLAQALRAIVDPSRA